MLGFLPSKNKGVQVGIDFMPTGIAAVEVSNAKKSPGMLRRCEFLPSVGAGEQAEALARWVNEAGLKNADCVSLIARHDVQLFQLEKPSVDDSEMLQAVTWKIKDLISYDVATAVVDVFEMPKSPKSPVQQINAVVANEHVIAGYVDLIRATGLNLKAIDVHELVARNFYNLSQSDASTVALLELRDNEGLLSIYHETDLYVTRDFKIGLLSFEGAGEEAEAVYDNILLELQRSMDYFESSYGMGAVQKMLLFPATPGSEKMAAYLQNYVNYDLDFAVLPGAADDHEVDPHCFSAYCAALRGVVA